MISDLPQTPAVLLNTTQSEEAPPPKVRPQLGIAANKQHAEAMRMQSMRLQKVLQDFHFIATDVSEPEEKRLDAARQLAMSMNTHFETLIWALRTAGGAARP